jgi:hypothetical protein
MGARTFDELRGTDSDGCTTLAYWLGPYSGTLDEQGILGVAGAMSSQYDFEDQADAYGCALPEDQEWPKVFKPVAPVQLALGWSPLPCAASYQHVNAVSGHTARLMNKAGFVVTTRRP